MGAGPHTVRKDSPTVGDARRRLRRHDRLRCRPRGASGSSWVPDLPGTDRRTAASRHRVNAPARPHCRAAFCPRCRRWNGAAPPHDQSLSDQPDPVAERQQIEQAAAGFDDPGLQEEAVDAAAGDRAERVDARLKRHRRREQVERRLAAPARCYAIGDRSESAREQGSVLACSAGTAGAAAPPSRASAWQAPYRAASTAASTPSPGSVSMPTSCGTMSPWRRASASAARSRTTGEQLRRGCSRAVSSSAR